MYGPDLFDDVVGLMLAGCLPPGVAGKIATASGFLPANVDMRPIDPLPHWWEPLEPVDSLPGHVSPGPMVDRALLGWAVSR
jgi:hypothetical protein